MSGTESGGKTTLKFERTISTCFWESFDKRDVGDVAVVKFIVGNNDLTSVDPTPSRVTTDKYRLELSSPAFFPLLILLCPAYSAVVKTGRVTLFGHSQTKLDQLNTEFEGLSSFSAYVDATNLVAGSSGSQYALCRAKKTTASFTHYRGFAPDFSVSSEL